MYKTTSIENLFRQKKQGVYMVGAENAKALCSAFIWLTTVEFHVAFDNEKY